MARRAFPARRTSISEVMRVAVKLLLVVALLWRAQMATGQSNRVGYNAQKLFLSGANLAWLNFAKDIGNGEVNSPPFANILLSMHDNGGNALRWWLHTDGTITPLFDGSGLVIGPGTGALADMRRILDLAWEREIGVILCLWSFDMLTTSNSSVVRNRNLLLLADANYTRAYIDNSLIPMVRSLRGHPAIIAWEIFNEPEGMSDEFGWSGVDHVPMVTIQRFINLCAGAIHRSDTLALVTSGAWSFKALTDAPTAAPAGVGASLARLGPTGLRELKTLYARKYHAELSVDEIVAHIQKVHSVQNYNYYSDSRLIAAGGDPKGTLDFFSVHYYDWAGTALSPFHRPANQWGLNKPVVVAEFALKPTLGIPMERLYDTLYQRGYAGALAWAWTDTTFSRTVDMLSSMKRLWDSHQRDVDVNGIGGDWPVVQITSPASNTAFAANADVSITAEASDRDGSVIVVEFFMADSVKLGEARSTPYAFLWRNAVAGLHSLTARATDNQGHQRVSLPIRVTVGTPFLTLLEAEDAVFSGTPAVLGDPTASGGACLRTLQTGNITWTLPAVPAAGTTRIIFGFRLTYDHPKSQYVNINGRRVAELVFDGPMYTWLEKGLDVTLVKGINTIQIELSWGWMDFDYLAVPTVLTTPAATLATGIPEQFALEQNYPNPFNPTTVVRYQLPAASEVKLAVYDILGREVSVLVNGPKAPGRYEVRWDASGFPSGVYVCRMEAGTIFRSKGMMLLK